MAVLKMVVLLLCLLATAQQSMQMRFTKPPHEPSGFGVSEQQGSSLGLVVVTPDSETAVFDSGLFETSETVQIRGRKFIKGTIHGQDIVYVYSSISPSVHLAVTLQLMVDYFPIHGIIHFSGSGTTNDSLRVGDVVVPSYYKFTGAFEWQAVDVDGDLIIKEYNSPKEGDNLLGSLEYAKRLEVYYQNHVVPVGNIFPITPTWINRAIDSDIQIDEYNITYNTFACSSDVYVTNPSYRKFLFEHFNCSTVDITGVNVASVGLSSGKDFIVFLGVSDTAGADSEDNRPLANKNAFSAVSQFIQSFATSSAAYIM